jgi:transcriptional regulator GlxA family with amidase domain
MTIQRFIIHSRVHTAAHELTHSERSMAEIALMFGFSDQSAFSDTFRKVIGLAPARIPQTIPSGLRALTSATAGS